MSLQQNTRRPVSESADPKQRIVGGIVLFLIVLFIYSTLKLVLGISAGGGGKFVIGDEYRELSENATTSSSEANTTSSGSHPVGNNLVVSNRPLRLPKAFVFLDISGEPLQKESSWQAVTSNISNNKSSKSGNKSNSNKDATTSTEEGNNWFVQAASFREEERAKQLVQKIKDKNIVPEVNIVRSSNGWYSVRLPPQADREVAEKQRKQLNSLLRIKAEVKKVE